MVVGCQLYAPPVLTPRKCSWNSFLLEAESTPKDFMSMKNPLAPAGIEPATFRFVAQRLNHYATAVPHNITNTPHKICAIHTGEEKPPRYYIQKSG